MSRLYGATDSGVRKFSKLVEMFSCPDYTAWRVQIARENKNVSWSRSSELSRGGAGGGF